MPGGSFRIIHERLTSLWFYLTSESVHAFTGTVLFVNELEKIMFYMFVEHHCMEVQGGTITV
jgi:hypothetical protein